MNPPTVNVEMSEAHGPFEADISQDKTVDEISEPIIVSAIDVLPNLIAPSVGAGNDSRWRIGRKGDPKRESDPNRGGNKHKSS